MHAGALPVAVTVAALLAGAGLSAPAIEAGPRRAGRVVWVPRPPLVLSTAVRTCSLYEESHAACDRAVQTGDIGIVIDDEGNYGAATIRAVDPQPDSCGTPAAWNIELELQDRAAEAPRHGLLVLDYPLEERARILAPPTTGPRDGERVVQVLDVDGDGDGDLRVTQFACDHKGGLDRTSRPSHHCTDYWLAIRDRWQRARSDRAPVCDRR